MGLIPPFFWEIKGGVMAETGSENAGTQVATPEVKPDIKPNAAKERMYEITNGKGEKQTVPESQLIERYKKAEGLESRVATAAKLEQAFNAFVAQAQDPQQLLNLLQHPSLKYDEEKQEMLVKSMLNSKNQRIIKAVKQWLYENEVEPSTLTPEERERRELIKYKEEQEKRNKELADQQEKQKYDEEVKGHWDAYRIKIGSELNAQGIPMKESNVARVARYALLYTRQGKAPDITDCVKRVKADLIAEFNDIYKDANEETILDRIPPEMAKLINSAYVKKLKPKPVEKEKPKFVSHRDRIKEKEMSRAERRQWLKNLERGIVD